MRKVKQVVTIAGSDSSGGAGIQADLKTFQERGVYGASIIVAITAQNTLGVQAVYPSPLDSVKTQFDSVFSDLDIAGLKTGMLVNKDYIRLLADEIKRHPEIPYVLDPVMIAKGGAPLMDEDSMNELLEYLIPLATLITPNIPEAEKISGRAIETTEDMVEVAKIIRKMGVKNVLIKGGHLQDSQSPTACDYLLQENGEGFWYESERIFTKNTHGTGDTLSACILAELAKGKDMQNAVDIGKEFIQAAIADGILVGAGHGPVNHWKYREIESK